MRYHHSLPHSVTDKQHQLGHHRHTNTQKLAIIKSAFVQNCRCFFRLNACQVYATLAVCAVSTTWGTQSISRRVTFTPLCCNVTAKRTGLYRETNVGLILSLLKTRTILPSLKIYYKFLQCWLWFYLRVY